MIRILESKTTDVVGKYWYYLICDEGDTKPTSEFPADSGKTIANGSRLFETGTEIRYEYNNGSWTAVGQEDVTLIEKTITENGTYDPADDEADGYNSVTVNVPNDNNAKFILTPFEEDPEFSFQNCLQKISLPDGTKSLIDNAFAYCEELIEVIIPEGFMSIAEQAFFDCKKLKQITLPSSVSLIDLDAFQGSYFETITIHKAEGSIEGAPWGAPETTQIIWDGE